MDPQHEGIQFKNIVINMQKNLKYTNDENVTFEGELHETCTCPVRYQANFKH